MATVEMLDVLAFQWLFRDDSDNGKNGDDGFLVENYVVGNDVGFNGCGNISTSL